jgi:hypothetical protein
MQREHRIGEPAGEFSIHHAMVSTPGAKFKKSRRRTRRGGFHAVPDRSGGATDHLLAM